MVKTVVYLSVGNLLLRDLECDLNTLAKSHTCVAAIVWWGEVHSLFLLWDNFVRLLKHVSR